MSTRCKVMCESVEKRAWNPGFAYTTKLRPVYTGSPENDRFYAATPGGLLELATLREDHFEVGKTYYVDFTPCEEETP